MEKIRIILGFLEFFYIYGITGSCELGSLSISQYIIRVLISLLIIAVIRKAATVIASNNRRRVHNGNRYKRELPSK